MPIHYVAIKVSEIERSGRFYDSVLAPLGWRRQENGASTVGWGLIKAADFFIVLDETQRPGFGRVSFPANSIPAVKASFESGMNNGGKVAAEPGSAPSNGAGNYAARLIDPDGYEVEIVVSNP